MRHFSTAITAVLPPPPTFADFFAGIGLVRLGLEQAGWRSLYANDFNPKKRAMYDGHFADADVHYELADVHQVAPSRLPSVTLAHASFPCTDLSLAGARAGLNGAGSSAYWGFVDLLESLGTRRPPLVTLENVPGFATSNQGRDLHVALAALCELGYAVDVLTIDASAFVPQSRVRLFVIATQRSIWQINPFETARTLGLHADPYRSERLRSFIRKNPDLDWHIRPLPLPPSRTLSLGDVIDQDASWWTPDRVRYLLSQMFDRHRREVDQMKAGTTWSYGTVFRRMRQRDGARRSTAELRTDGIAGCLRTPKGGSAKQILLRAGHGHVDARLLSPRECARLMGADDYAFAPGLSANDLLFGFGDAVCASVITWLAEHYLHPLLETAQAPAVFTESDPWPSLPHSKTA